MFDTWRTQSTSTEHDRHLPNMIAIYRTISTCDRTSSTECRTSSTYRIIYISDHSRQLVHFLYSDFFFPRRNIISYTSHLHKDLLHLCLVIQLGFHTGQVIPQVIHTGYYSAESLRSVHNSLTTAICPTNLGPFQVRS
jgi:hypothetical protein